MDEIERNARLHAEKLGMGTASAYYYARQLAAAGLTLAPIEPDLLAALPEWREIETAPKGKALVDLWKGGRHTNCFFEDGKWKRVYRWTEGPKGNWARRSHVIDDPTHWRPLPEPPA